VNAERFEDFYREAWPGAVRLAHLLTGVNAVAEDLAQEAFTRMSQRWATIEHPAAYLRVAILNASHSWHRAGNREAARLRRVTPPTEYQTELVANELRDVIEALPYRQRAVIVLRYYADLSEAEIADALGCRRGTVKSLAARALQQMRTVISK
jgi:RNA polymerase sigma-70 factor (sigma-E family)